MKNDEHRLGRIVGAAAGVEPLELQNYFASLKEGGPYIWGSATRLLAPSFKQDPASKIYFPVGYSPAKFDRFATVYLMLSEYFEFPPELIGLDELSSHRIMAKLLGISIPRRHILIGLAILNHWTYHADKLEEFQRFFEAALAEPLRERFEAAMYHSADDTGRAFLYRQAILNTMRMVLLSEESPFASEEAVPLEDMLMLSAAKSHAIAGTLGPNPDPSGPRVVGLPVSVFMEVICSDLFNRPRHMTALLRRHIRLWKTYGPKVKRDRARARPTILFREASGLGVDQAIGFALVLYLMLAQWKPGEGFWYASNFEFSALPTETKRAFVELVSIPLDDLAKRVAGPRSLWDFLAFEQKPVVRDQEDNLLILDEGLLLDRVLSGLYWIVHDHEKSQHGESARLRWSQAYGEMIELMAEDQIHSTAPMVAGFGRETTFYTEDEIRRAYGLKACDAAVHYGEGICLFEIVSGRVSTGTRIDGWFPDFERDTKRLVLGKVEQLDTSAQAILRDERALTGHNPIPGLVVRPILVIGGSYPFNPISELYLEDVLSRTTLLRHPRIGSLAIIDLDELEMLEGLAEHGATPLELLDGWKSSDFRQHPLRNYLIHRFGPNHNFEPKRVDTELHEALLDLAEALQLKT